LQIAIKQGLRWAGSNIYWNGTRLTFAAPGTDDNQSYQGVYFRWGSLVGISPKDAFVANTTPIYVPTAINGNVITWAPTNVTAAKAAHGWTVSPNGGTNGYDSIPYDNTGSANLDTYTPSGFKGDICRFLSHTQGIPDGNWVMPTRADFELIGTGWKVTSPTPFLSQKYGDAGAWTSWTTNNTIPSSYADAIYGTYGKETTHWRWGASYCNTTTVFPASGFRYGSDGSLSETGCYGSYWSSSGYNTSNAYYWYFTSGSVSTTSYTYRGSGLSVRCVLQHD
jgi:uncharacterized protein (TIGR02145 family)